VRTEPTRDVSLPVRTALVGLGKVARNFHLPALEHVRELTLVATVDPNGSALCGVPAFTSLSEALAETAGLQAVVLCTPPTGRYELACEALSRGVHVFLEKPPAASLAEIHALQDVAGRNGATLFTSWHSSCSPAVKPAREWLQARNVRSVRIHWEEDVRDWHRGQDWIFNRGGFGVFDPGINALSILTAILAVPIFVDSARLSIPANRHAPIAATLNLKAASGTPIAFELDFLRAGVPRWDIVVETDSGKLEIKERGFGLSIDGKPVEIGPEQEYRHLYARFLELVQAGHSDVDVRPLMLVADAFMLADVTSTEAFEW
jgi:D-galactose 1-dehydrogenase